MLDVFLDSMVRAGRIDGPAKPWLPPSHRRQWTPSSPRRQARHATAGLLRALGTALVRVGQTLEAKGNIAPTS
jgi:hypothetical protein